MYACNRKAIFVQLTSLISPRDYAILVVDIHDDSNRTSTVQRYHVPDADLALIWCAERFRGCNKSQFVDGKNSPMQHCARPYHYSNRRTAMANEINPGSVVKLKSGGPKMTVESVFQDTGGKMCVRCSWFEAEKKVSSAFDLEAVEALIA
jgi:uncharacterized protein YodC (DUF2158 family)